MEVQNWKKEDKTDRNTKEEAKTKDVRTIRFNRIADLN